MSNLNHAMVRLISGVLALTAFTGITICENAQAQDNGNYQRRERESRKPRREGPSPFVMGLCIGQTAARQGVTLPMPEAGKPPALDETQKAAFHSAMESCRAELTGQAMPQPTATAPSALPTTPGVPTSAPTGAASPTVNASPTVVGPDTASP